LWNISGDSSWEFAMEIRLWQAIMNSQGASATPENLRQPVEETGLEVIPVHELLSVQHSYDHAELDLDFWLCRPADASDELFQQTLHGFHWIPAAELPDLSFPAANSEIVELLVKEYASE